MKVVGAMLVQNEDMYLRQCLENVADFVDIMVVADTGSTDGTMEILDEFEDINFEVFRTPYTDTHQIIEKFAGGDYWVCGINGDEVYDKYGLAKVKQQMLLGEHDETFRLYGKFFHVTQFDPDTLDAMGYLTPPSHAPFKFYNFQHVLSWNDDHNRTLFLSGDCVFKPEWKDRNLKPNGSPNSNRIHQECSWGDSLLRCAHMHFIRRSSVDMDYMVGGRLSAEDKIGCGSHRDRGGREDINLRLKYKKGDIHRINLREFFV